MRSDSEDIQITFVKHELSIIQGRPQTHFFIRVSIGNNAPVFIIKKYKDFKKFNEVIEASFA